MSKGARRSSKKKAQEKPTPAAAGGGLVAVLRETRQALRSLVLEAGFGVFAELLEEDREELCGPRHSRSDERRAYRHGYDEGRLVMGGRQVRLRKPRVRGVDGDEVSLPTWASMRDDDPLEARAVEQILCGVSTRKYERSLEEELPDDIDSAGTSKSAVSRRFVARTRREVEAFLSRPLDDLDFPVLMFDGVHMGKHLLIVALGITADGSKRVLGLVEGSSESERTCRTLLRQLLDRGLVVERRRLVVLDGSRGLRSAVRKTFGDWCVVQRCRVHKMRNVADHLPKHLRPWFQAKIRKAWNADRAEDAEAQLLTLASELERDHPGAGGSLREGLDETLTVSKLGVSGALLQSLRSTNCIENLLGSLKYTARNVKRWRGGSMVVRWAVTGAIEAESRFRRIRGFRELHRLESGLATLIKPDVEEDALTA